MPQSSVLFDGAPRIVEFFSRFLVRGFPSLTVRETLQDAERKSELILSNYKLKTVPLPTVAQESQVLRHPKPVTSFPLTVCAVAPTARADA